MQEACKEKAVYTVPKCPCHLCQKTVFIECDKDEVACYNMNGKIIAVNDMENCTPPTIFCPYIDMWKSLFYPCCCTNHKKPGDCELNGKTQCSCSRCCFACMYNIKMYKIWPALTAGGNKIDCQTCQLKCFFYTPCKHFRGFCDF